MDIVNSTGWLILVLLISLPLQYFSYQRTAGFKNERAAQANLIRTVLSLCMVLYIVFHPLQNYSPLLQLVTSVMFVGVVIYVSEAVLKKWTVKKS